MAIIDSKQYIVIRLNTELYGINIKYIENIIVMQNITRVPKAQPYFKGVINLRGEVIPVMSLRSRLGLEDSELTSKARIIIVKPYSQAAPIGLIVNEVKEVITLEDENIEKLVYDDNGDNANFNIGVGKYNNELITLLNIQPIVIDKEISMNN